MKLSSLESLPSFALLGPGFFDGQCALLTDLCESSGSPQLIYAPFECPGKSPRTFFCRSIETVEIDFDVPVPNAAVTLCDDGYAQAIERIRRAIADGDVYQVCLTLRADLTAVTGAELVTLLCRNGLPRFLAWVRLPGGDEFVSASPELFFETDGRQVHTEPMKGTARSDHSSALELSEKDRAELAMITDLLRNDLTPVCTPRSVKVTCERRTIELPYAVQTVSDIEGELNDDVTPLDVLASLHPGGSITGAPKQAALEFIRELETTPRGAYCGALGLWRNDRSVFSLLIRTAERTGDRWIYGVGSGVVYDSAAEVEHREWLIKLGALGLPLKDRRGDDTT
jgi:anthranilate/para-aminobenzoate synthase component I